MSKVTNVLLSYSVIDKRNPSLSALKCWCENNNVFWPNHTVDAVSAGSKHMEVIVYAWGANHFDREGFFDAVKNVKWESRDEVQIFVKGEDDKRFVVYSLIDNIWTQYNEVEPE